MPDSPNDAFPRVTTPTTVVIFGATGALAKRKLFPALAKLKKQGIITDELHVVGVARQEMTDEAFRSLVESSSQETAGALATLHYLQGDVTGDDWVASLRSRLAERADCRVLFYLAIAPSLFGPVIKTLGQSGLAGRDQPRTSVLVEKPFGHDLASARGLDEVIASYFEEEQVYRMDHYLGKDTVQNILALRFENGLFEPIWNAHHLDHVQITLAEPEGIGARGNYFEEAGALRDVVQNHLLQLVAHLGMEPPQDLSADSLRSRRAEVLKKLKPLTPESLGGIVRGQYAAGTDFLMGTPTAGYRQEEHVAPDSTVETFVALPVEIATKRWAGVPFYLRAGKRLPKDVTEITLQFKPSAHDLYKRESQTANLLTLRIQPNEGIALRLFIKKPGFTNDLEEVDMSFCYRDSFRGMLPEAYDRLLLDCLIGDQSLFPRTDEIESSWAFIDPILRHWQANTVRPTEYDGGTWGPEAADKLLEADGRRWWSDRLDVCPVPGTGQATMSNHE